MVLAMAVILRFLISEVVGSALMVLFFSFPKPIFFVIIMRYVPSGLVA